MTAATRTPSLTPETLCRLMDLPFSAQQLDVITAPLEPAAVVAGAGSGKTTVMAARVVWLVGTEAVRADQVLGLTFTNKAAAELRGRITSSLTRAGYRSTAPASGWGDDAGVAEPTVLTYHAYAGQLLREHGLRIGHEPDVTLLTDASRFQLAERAVRRHRAQIEHLTTSLAHVVRYVLELDAQLCEHLVTPAALRTWQRAERTRWRVAKQTTSVRDVLVGFAGREELLGLVEDYRALKAERGVMDFSDAMAAGATLAEACDDVGRQERASYPVVLLDEYQDTSVAQARLLRALFSGAGRGHPVTAVGDPCQAIYGWRGASANNLDAFMRDFPVADGGGDGSGRRFPLSVNRRSQTDILDTANDLAQTLHAEQPGSRPLQAPPGTPTGQVRAAVVETYDDELAFLAREIPIAHALLPTRQWSDIAVLVRDNAAAADIHDRLAAVDVPVEVVGLSGLLARPEVVDVVATLEVLHDATANPALLQLLTSARWNVGHRDLALLGRRARELARTGDPTPESLARALELAVAGSDPADAVSLLEALHDPGPERYSSAARERFAALSSELRALQRHGVESLLAVVRRVIDTIGVDVELAASNSRLAESRRDNLATFVDAVAAFAGVGGEASLPRLLAYLRAEEEYAAGLPLALPSAANSVKVLTIHKAKGLEWDVVFLPGVTREVFPTRRTRSRWTTAPQELPWPLRGDAADLPSVPSPTRAGLREFAETCREHELKEERRLAYVACTRARQTLVVSAYWWGPTQVRVRGPSEFLNAVVASMRSRGATPEVWVARPPEDAENPDNRARQAFPWPVDSTSDERDRRRNAAELVRNARAEGWREAAARADVRLSAAERAEVDRWDVEIARLIEEAEATTAREVVVPLPRSLSATAALRLRHDPASLARDLARPMPRKPSPAARFGSRFHAWVEAHVGQQQLLAVEDLPGRADAGIVSDAELQKLIAAFTDGPFGDRPPLQLEAAFTLILAGHVIRGRIDAVYRTDGGYLVIDWKTQHAQTADPLQLAIYRTAWAELCGVDDGAVRAAFYYVRSGDLVEPADLPRRSDLERLFS